MNHVGLSEVFTRTMHHGLADTTRRAVRRLYRTLDSSLGLGSLDFPLASADIASTPGPYRQHWAKPDSPLGIGWICTPPSPGSGGHTTLFRMVQGMEERGHRCTILLYSPRNSALKRHSAVIRNCWPDLRADIAWMPERLSGFDACVASSWETAHALAVRGSGPSGPRPYYFIQDYEPYFYPRGSLYALAEDSYRLGFSHLALGPMVASTLRRELGVEAKTIPFGSDRGIYNGSKTISRDGVVFFVKPGVDRRGYDMGRLALQAFHRLHPEQTIHLYGGRVRDWQIPVIQHGMLTPSELNQLYNQTISGLALSFTNITLVAAEMLAAGNIAVLNDHPFSRSVLTNPEASWAAPNPVALARELGAVVSDPGRGERAERAAAHAEGTWAATQTRFAEALTTP